MPEDISLQKILIDKGNGPHDISVLKSPINLIIHTGNVANWHNLKSRKAQVPANELFQSLQTTLLKWNANSSNDNEEKCCEALDDYYNNDEERPLVTITVKILLHKFKTDFIESAVNTTLDLLSVTYFDTLILALPPLEESEESFQQVVFPYWEVMEKLNRSGIAKVISSCDLDQQKLQSLIEKASIPPMINQVNLTSCCHMPQDLVAFAKENNIILHTHGDQQVMLGEIAVDNLIKSADPTNNLLWETNWVVRYAVVIKCRGVIKSKGYIASLSSKHI